MFNTTVAYRKRNTMFFRQKKLKAGILEGLKLVQADDRREALAFLSALIAHFKFGVAQMEGMPSVDDEKLATLIVAILKRVPDASLDEFVGAFGEVLKDRYLPS